LSSPTGSSSASNCRTTSADIFSFAALSTDELRQALPANYGDSLDEIRLVSALGIVQRCALPPFLSLSLSLS
jgi:hypothetical protein